MKAMDEVSNLSDNYSALKQLDKFCLENIIDVEEKLNEDGYKPLKDFLNGTKAGFKDVRTKIAELLNKKTPLNTQNNPNSY